MRAKVKPFTLVFPRRLITLSRCSCCLCICIKHIYDLPTYNTQILMTDRLILWLIYVFSSRRDAAVAEVEQLIWTQFDWQRKQRRWCWPVGSSLLWARANAKVITSRRARRLVWKQSSDRRWNLLNAFVLLVWGGCNYSRAFSFLNLFDRDNAY